MARVLIHDGLNPEDMAMLQALYSRSAPRLREAILKTAAATREPLFKSTIAAALRDPDKALAELASSVGAVL